MPSLLWDVFCRVVDNHGDLGVCLRLTRELMARDQRVRLWVDDARALTWMATSSEERTWVHPWPELSWSVADVGDVIIEAFGCHLAPCVEARLAQAPPRAWINLEYLSAEPWVARTHGLSSPVLSGPAKGLSKRFCFPGFGAQTGGLLRAEEVDPFDPHSLPIPCQLAPEERTVSLFCYPHAPLDALLYRLSDRPTRVMVLGDAAMTAACTQAHQRLPAERASNITLHPMPKLHQLDYDRLLKLCDLNVVRGEDSFVRAQWAGKPFLWHIYHQDDGAHAAKLNAFLDIWLPKDPQLASAWRRSWHAWNGLTPALELAKNHADGLDSDGLGHALRWRDTLRHWPDLVDTLMQWVQANP